MAVSYLKMLALMRPDGGGFVMCGWVMWCFSADSDLALHCDRAGGERERERGK